MNPNENDKQYGLNERTLMNPDLYGFHKLNSDGQEKAVQIAKLFDDLTAQLQVLCTESRAFSITKTKLEEACFFAKKAMAINLANQEHGNA